MEPREECLAVTIWFESPLKSVLVGRFILFDEAQAVLSVGRRRNMVIYDDIFLRHVAQNPWRFSQNMLQDTA